MEQQWFQRGYRRMLVDMHIPDWDPAFLARYDPSEMVRLYQQAGLTSVMFYAQSHVGLCYWPTKSGRMHAGLRGRDIVGETLQLLKKVGIAACGYYSVIYNNWAYLEHPQWRLLPADEAHEPGAAFSGGRYGICCPNNQQYRDFVQTQLTELVGGYSMDGLFIDMTFWPRICVCDHCRAAYQRDAAAEIPATIDWFSPEWCRFQTTRERWITAFATDITAWAKSLSPGISVYHNFATAMFNWTLGLSLEASQANDYLGADFYGDSLEQLVVSKLMSNLSANRPMEFGTSRCVNLNDHETNKSRDEIRMQALAATLFGGAVMFIDAINPDGTANPRPYQLIREVYDEMSLYEPYLAGEPVEDVAIYYSSESKMDFAENGTPLAEARLWASDYPHKRAVRGVSQALQQAHVPFGIISRRQLADLNRYKVIVLPNVLRMDQDEVKAFRQYVQDGGRLYASRLTSLTESVGRRHDDFMLADVFGCHVEADDSGHVSYLKPCHVLVKEAIAPQNYMSCLRPRSASASPANPKQWVGAVRLRRQAEASVLATLTLPYSPQPGTVHDEHWSSIHSNPPWHDTAAPVLVSNDYGQGRAIYSAIDIESLEGKASRQLLVALINDLLADGQTASAYTHHSVWMSVRDQADQGRMIVAFLNYQPQLPPVPIAQVRFTLRPPAGRKFVALRTLPAGEAVEFHTLDDGMMSAMTPELTALIMLEAQYV